MNVVARQSLSMNSNPLFANGFRPRQAWALLWVDVRSTSRRI
ncbi:hypothetical protein amb1387 [Paramagnetospirillum magneticum AMB-1]|jgi:hypothetical protein|uniref:Uncharacterized protein n=1 Tax=Paramagnetospirillum magneticum (strain ATCC 700264 / AMB-1) TaxID=342108 RepID=Q2W7I4_PARM1|nr:hypothetical protein amb1387 [Paramagnetospirillum magneticum AMB-1]